METNMESVNSVPANEGNLPVLFEIDCDVGDNREPKTVEYKNANCSNTKKKKK